MKRDKLTILMVVEQCNPDWASVPLLAYHTVSHVAKQNGTRVILITHERNKKGLSQSNVDRTIFIPESKFEKAYYKLISSLTQFHSKRIWPLYHLLNYPLF